MEEKEIESVLKSFTILADTREQDTERSRRRLAAMNANVERCALGYGDYAATIRVGDVWITDPARPRCVIERKMDLDELAMCLTRERERFRREFQRARRAGAQIFLLIENASWEALLAGRYRSRFHPKAFLASLCAWIVRYELHLIFCDELTTPILIREILYRDMKERLMNGEYG